MIKAREPSEVWCTMKKPPEPERQGKVIEVPEEIQSEEG
jgi:hypothetical protein